MSINKKIIDAIKQRDNKAIFSLLYKNYFSMVYSIIKKYNGNKTDAEDVFQEMLLILIREVDSNRINENRDIKNYIYTISKNLFINIRKKNAKTDSYDTVPEIPEVQNHLELQQSEHLILKIMAELGSKCYEILKAIIFENKKQEEIAEDLGLKDRKVVKTYKNRCKNKLIELLKSNSKLSLELLKNEDGFAKYIRVN